MAYPISMCELPYAYTALAPQVSETTLHFHHDKHLQTYIDNLNKALEACPECQAKSLEDLLVHVADLTEPQQTAIRNNGGGVYNHCLYFNSMSERKHLRPSGAMADAVERAFGSYETWEKEMKKAAMGQFGSGYAFLVSDHTGALSVLALPNQNSPLSQGLWPILCLDVWEHAYYLDYQNRRADYVDAWLERVNWEFATEHYGCGEQH